MEKILGYIRLMRPANVVTSVADVLAGIAISGYFLGAESYLPVLLLCISTIGLYGGGIIFNDVFDAALDKVERPERSIPSGLITVKEAVVFGAAFFAVGVIAAGLINPVSLAISLLIVVACLTYNKWMKHHFILGPLNMGLCRGLNLLLGISILAPQIQSWWFLAIIPIIYIASITMISRGEVHGGSKKTLYFASLLYLVVINSLLYFSYIKNNFILTLVFVLPFAWMIFRPLIKAFINPVGKNIGKAVKAGVIALILMNAAWATAFGAWEVALIIAMLLPLSLWLSKTFAVT
ncbi:4-hydroxybenzoate polyprenyltransferase [Pedobacter sp. CG_S7]|uniref:UbiA-like protein EboC n=1 Tax=Pedobacter sp. CG_S7 TaxID=3143930 RepID=UPI0033921FCE